MPLRSRTQRTIALNATRAASSSGRPEPTNITSSAFSIRGTGVGWCFTSSTKSSTFIAPSIAAPMISPSPMA